MARLLVELAAAAALAQVVAPGDPCRPADAARAAQRFASLDAYLAERAKGGLTDAPFYKRLADGRYACVVYPKPPTPPATFTREELAQAYGFSPRRP